jgi:hypothetical protein
MDTETELHRTKSTASTSALVSPTRKPLCGLSAGPPLDLSFAEFKSVSEIVEHLEYLAGSEEKPLTLPPIKTPGKANLPESQSLPLFLGDKVVTTAVAPIPIKLYTSAIKLSNNKFSTIVGLQNCFGECHRFTYCHDPPRLSSTDADKIDPTKIQWIDLSFNELTSVEETLLHFPNLRSVYLHG